MQTQDTLIRDGETVTVPIFAMDAQQRAVAASAPLHRPGAVPLTDTDRAARITRQALGDRKLSERWKTPSPTAAAAKAGQASPDMASVYARADKALSERWRGGA